MRVEFLTIDDVCTEIDDNAHRIYESIVRLRVDVSPEQEENISQLVGMWVTAVVQGLDGQYLIEFGQVAGRDGPGDKCEGSQVAETWRQQVQSVCDKHGLNVRSGKIEIF